MFAALFGILIIGGMLIVYGIIAVVLAVFFIKNVIMNLMGDSKMKKDINRDMTNYKGSEAGSVGALIENGYTALDKGDVVNLLNTSSDRNDAIAVIEWFDRKVKNGKYYAARETNAKGQEPNYAIVMTNDSGYDFKSFECKASLETKTSTLPPAICKAENWKNGTEGYMWFYCDSMDVCRMRMDARDIKYVIDNYEKKDNRRGIRSRVDLNNIGGELDDEKFYGAYICPECGGSYDGSYCETCGHLNDMIGYEDVDDDEKFMEGMMAATLFDAEERRIARGEREPDWFASDEDLDDY